MSRWNVRIRERYTSIHYVTVGYRLRSIGCVKGRRGSNTVSGSVGEDKRQKGKYSQQSDGKGEKYSIYHVENRSVVVSKGRPGRAGEGE